MHDIGKSIVSIMVRGAGYEVIDLGIDVPVATIVDAVREHRPVAVGLSALLTTTMLVMREVIDALRDAGLRDGVKVLVGGAAVTDPYAREIGADGTSDDAYGAVELLRGA
jgi:5-methyltetrahydrofolate--homocysteine methyltransferase